MATLLFAHRRSVAVATVSAVLALLTSAGAAAAQDSAASFPHVIRRLKVVDAAYIDTTANACTDFFQYANGGWIAHDTIPADYSSSGVSRDMGDANELVVRSVLDDAVARRSGLPLGSTTRKLGTFFATCMDSSAIEVAGASPLRPWLSQIDSVTSRPQLLEQ